jgi:hypothetical protein
MFDGQTRGGLLAVLALAAAGNAAGQVPAGSEFRVNTYTTDRADQGRVALDARGNAVAVWQSRGQGAPRVIGRRFDSAGAPVGLEFPLNAFTSLVPVEPHVAAGPHGGFVVAWTGVVDSPPYPASVYVRRFDRNGAALGAEFPASAFAGNQSSPRVSIAPDGGFVVVWAGQAASSTDIFGQRFDAAGARIGAPFQVNTYAMFRQDAPSVGHDSRGGFVVVWRTYKTSYPLPGVAGQRYDASGQPVSAEFDVTLPLRPPTRPESAVRGDGGSW